jgi:hypothetical protein
MQLRQTQSAIKRAVILAKKASADIIREDYHDARAKLAAAFEAISAVESPATAAHAAVQELDHAIRALEETYDSVVIERCNKLHPDWAIKGTSRHYLVNGIVDVKVDPIARFTLVNRRRIKSVSPSRIVDAIEQELQRLWPPDFNGHIVLEDLWQAYLAILDGKSTPIGEFVKLKDVFFSLEQKRGAMDALQFGALLSRLSTEGPIETADGWRMHLAPVRSPRDSFPVIQGQAREGRGLLRFQRP